MEDPVRFEVWGKIIPEMRAEALAALRIHSGRPSELELRKSVMTAVRENQPLLVSSALGYQAAQELTASLANAFSELVLCQEGWEPDSGLYCPLHNFHFGGCLGCHICQGGYAR